MSYNVECNCADPWKTHRDTGGFIWDRQWGGTLRHLIDHDDSGTYPEPGETTMETIERHLADRP